MYDKLFKNNAPQPLRIPLIAVCGDDGTVTRIARRRGYASGLDDAQMAEAERIYTWARDLFVGQDITFFQSHNGVAPSPQADNAYARLAETLFDTPYKSARSLGKSEALGARFYSFTGDVNALKDKGARYAILEDIDPHAIAEAMLTTPGILDLLLTPPQTNVSIDFTFNDDDVIGDLEKWAKLIGTPPEWAHGIPVGRFDYRNYVKPDGPIPGTYWQSRTEPTRFFKLTSAVACTGHWHVEMHCLQDGEPEDCVWVSTQQWADLFTEVDRTTALAPLSPQSSVGPYASGGYTSEKPTGVPARVSSRFYRPVGRLVFPDMLKREQEQAVERIELRAERDERGNPLFSPELLEARDAAQPVIDATQQMLDYVPFKGTEAPPKPGEQYQRIDSDHVYTVVDATPGDMGVVTITMDSHKGGVFYGRQKHAFRSHAQWLAKWRPVDSEGNVKPVEFVDLEDFVDAALEGDDDKQVAAEVSELIKHENGTAIRWVNIIGRELDRRVPGWRDYDPPGVLYDDCALILRAIRTLNRHMLNYQNLGHELAERTSALVSDAQRDQKRLTELTTWINEMSRDATVSFKNTFGIEKAKGLLKEFGYANVMSIPLADRVSWVRKLREYTGMAGEL